MEDYVAEGKFRADLYYRLNVIPLTLPPLRERKSDIKLLVEHFMRQFLGDAVPALTSPVLEALLHYPWPGNIRELQNAVERAAILSQGRAPQENDFLLSKTLSAQVEKEVISAASASQEELVIRSGMTVHDMERKLIFETLKSTDNNRTQAAELLGISIRTLRNKLHEYRGGQDFDVGDDAEV